MDQKTRFRWHALIGEPDLAGFMGTALIENDPADTQHPVLQVSVWQDMDNDELYSTDESGDQDDGPEAWDLGTFQEEQDRLEAVYLDHVEATGDDYLHRLLDAPTNAQETWKLIFKVSEKVTLECGAHMPGGVPTPPSLLPEYVLAWAGAKSDGSTDVTPEIAYQCAYHSDGPYYYTKAHVVRPASEEERVSFKKNWARQMIKTNQENKELQARYDREDPTGREA